MPLPTPRIEIDLPKIEANTRTIVAMCHRAGVNEVIGVTKGTLAHPGVARAMLAGRATGLADARLRNLARLREEGFTAPLTLLRLPSLSQVDEVVRLADRSLNSEPETLRALSRAAVAAGRTHGVTLMVELGDRREGMPPEEVVETARLVAGLPGLELVGLGTNLTCYGAVIPSPANVGRLVELAETVRHEVGRPVPVVSGGNSSSLKLVMDGKLPRGVTELRIGDALMRGHETAYGELIPGTTDETFTVVAEVVEVREKPSLPDGEMGHDAFWNVPIFTDRGIRRRAILALGRQDVAPDNLAPLDQGMIVLGASSDHLLVDVSDAAGPVRLGDEVRFLPSYAGILQAMTSPYVDQLVVGDNSIHPKLAGGASR
ncbi:MAG: alanine/ornithine racemase family PLP-dependent enzyme [Bacillota bacterium]